VAVSRETAAAALRGTAGALPVADFGAGVFDSFCQIQYVAARVASSAAIKNKRRLRLSAFTY
jgi:hypothetical protein